MLVGNSMFIINLNINIYRSIVNFFTFKNISWILVFFGGVAAVMEWGNSQIAYVDENTGDIITNIDLMSRIFSRPNHHLRDHPYIIPHIVSPIDMFWYVLVVITMIKCYINKTNIFVHLGSGYTISLLVTTIVPFPRDHKYIDITSQIDGYFMESYINNYTVDITLLISIICYNYLCEKNKYSLTKVYLWVYNILLCIVQLMTANTWLLPIIVAFGIYGVSKYIADRFDKIKTAIISSNRSISVRLGLLENVDVSEERKTLINDSENTDSSSVRMQNDDNDDDRDAVIDLENMSNPNESDHEIIDHEVLANMEVTTGRQTEEEIEMGHLKMVKESNGMLILIF